MSIKPFHALDPILHNIPDLLYEESQFVQRLSDFIKLSIQPPFSLSVNGNWGSGKTTLMKALQNKFETQGFPVLWFNPWEYERVEDIVFCFLVELTRFAHSSLEGVVKELGIFGLSFITSGLDLTARLVTGNKLSFREVSNIEKEVREALQSRYVQENPVEVVKKDFALLTSRISEKHNKLPLIVFLDDLDRCLPDKALDLLEALKNIFVVPGADVIFISGIDTQVAKQFIIKRYEGLDANFAYNYFKKIFNFTVNVPVLTGNSFKKLIKNRLGDLLQNQDDNRITPEIKSELVEFLSAILVDAGVKSVRQAYNILHNWFFAIQIQPESLPKFKEYLIFFTMKECWPDLMDKLEKLANKKPDQRLQATLQEIEAEDISLFFRSLFDKLTDINYDIKNQNLLEM